MIVVRYEGKCKHPHKDVRAVDVHEKQPFVCRDTTGWAALNPGIRYCTCVCVCSTADKNRGTSVTIFPSAFMQHWLLLLIVSVLQHEGDNSHKTPQHRTPPSHSLTHTHTHMQTHAPHNITPVYDSHVADTQEQINEGKALLCLTRKSLPPSPPRVHPFPSFLPCR